MSDKLENSEEIIKLLKPRSQTIEDKMSIY